MSSVSHRQAQGLMVLSGEGMRVQWEAAWTCRAQDPAPPGLGLLGVDPGGWRT